jgi:pyridoxine 4-dehydrogenase
MKVGDLEVQRLGFGAMRVCGPSVWGPPKDRAHALRVLRRAYELGCNFFDTADSYGPYIDEELIAEALHPYPKTWSSRPRAALRARAPRAGTRTAGRRICDGLSKAA